MRRHEHRHPFAEYEPKSYPLEYQQEVFKDMRERQEPSYPMVWVVIAGGVVLILSVVGIVKRFFV